MLWRDSTSGETYAVVAAGAYGISVVDMTAFLVSGSQADLGIDKLLKTFEPIKVDEDNPFGSADGKSVDVQIIGNVAYVSYDSYGIVAYSMADLIKPLRPDQIAAGCEPTKMLIKNVDPKVDCRPVDTGRFKLQLVAGYEDLEGGAQYMTPQFFPAGVPYIDANGNVTRPSRDRLLFFVAYGDAGVVKIDWSDVEVPTLLTHKEVIGESLGTAIRNGRVYVAANAGGLTVLKK